MKVKEVVKKIHYGTAQLPVYLQDGAFGKKRKVELCDFTGDYFDEQNYMLTAISIRKDEVVIHYQPKF